MKDTELDYNIYARGKHKKPMTKKAELRYS